MAESEGFEPSIPTRSITIFETVAFDHSASSPHFAEIFHLRIPLNIYQLKIFASFFVDMKAKKRQFLQYVAEKSLQKTDFKGISFKKSKIIACKICKKL